MVEADEKAVRQIYWRENRRWMLILGSIWFAVSLGCGVLWVEPLNQIQLGGFKLGFWFAQQGSIYTFIALIFVYARVMARLEARTWARGARRMSLTETTYWVVGASFALYVLIAIRSRAGSTQEFYVAGKGIHPVANGMATAADWMSAASFISMAGLIGLSYTSRYGGSVFLMGWTGGYVILAMLIAPYLRKYGKFTVPEFIGDRYYSDIARVVAVICLIICSVTYVIGQMKGIGVAFSRFLETDYETGLFSGMLIVFFYAVLGGMKGITYTQIAQFCVLIFAYTVPAIFISLQLTGQPIPQLGLGSTLADGTYLLEKLDRTLLELGFQEYTTSVRGSTLNMAAFTASLMIGTAGLPHVIIRFFTVPTVQAARTSAGWALVFIAILYTTSPGCGGYGSAQHHSDLGASARTAPCY